MYRAVQMKKEVEAILNKTENILYSRADFNSLYEALNSIQKATVIMALLNSTLNQLDAISKK